MGLHGQDREIDLPFLYLARSGLLGADNLVAVQQAKRVIGQFQLERVNGYVSFVM
jgi:hypothetical protein